MHQQVTQLESVGWLDFAEIRKSWDLVINRKDPVQLEDSLAAYAAGFDRQSPDAEFFLDQMVQILKINPTKIDCVSLDSGERAKDDVEDLRIWLGSQWAKLNDKRAIDTARAEAACRYGVAVERLFWDMPEEPGETADRDAYFQGLNSDSFRLETVNSLECMWLPVTSEPELFIQRSEVSYVEATKLQNQDGQWASLDEMDKVVFLAERAPVNAGQANKKVKVITRAMLDKSTGKWTIANFIQPGDKPEDTAQLDEREVPLSRCPYFIIPSGNEKMTETNPHLRYRPPIYFLVCSIKEWNYQVTSLAALIRKWSQMFYMDLSQLRPDQQAVMEEVFPVEGSGASRRLVFRFPDPGSNDIPASPHIERVPFELPETQKTLLDIIKEDMVRYAPSRFQTGTMERTEIAESAATTVVNMMQASALPWSSHLANFDGYGTKPILLALLECIRNWDEGSPAGAMKKYFTVSDGEEPLSRGAPDPGTQVYVDATKSARPFSLIVRTANETQAEEQQAALVAAQDRQLGLITKKQHLQRRGFQDPGRQEEELLAEHMEDLFRPKADIIDAAAVESIYSALIGVSVPALLQASPPMVPPGQQEKQPGGVPPPAAAQVLPTPNGQSGGSSGQAPESPQ